MAMIIFFPLLCGVALASQLGWPTGSVHHAYYDTPKGQLHYVTRLPKSSSAKAPPLVYLHAHPRSSADFKYVFAELEESIPFIAVDWFGMGWSEDYKGTSTADEFCTFEEFAMYVLEILKEESVTEFVPAGFLKGAHPAIEVAAQAGQQRVKNVALMGVLVLSPDQQKYIQNVLVPNSKHPKVFANGSHLQNVWQDPSGTFAQYPGEELVNQEKTNDALRSMFTNWQMQAAWAAYNEKLPTRLAEVDVFARTMMVHPLIAYQIWSQFGLAPDYSLDQIGKALTHGHNTSFYIEASEGMLHQNASYIAKLIQNFAYKSGTAVV